MTVYKYDSSMEGFFSAVFEIYTRKKLPDKITCRDDFQLGLDTEIIEVKSDIEHYQRIKNGIKKYIGIQGFHGLEYAFASGEPEKEMKIFLYIRAVFKHGSDVLQMLSLPEIIEFNLVVSRVTYEIERIKGFLRFSQLSNGIFLASYTPDNDITRFILPYFAARNGDMSFIIFDKSRGIMGLCNGEECDIILCDKAPDEVFTEEEAYCRTMWQQYFNTVSIASRKNKRLQDGWLPRRYRKNMNEFTG